MAVLLLTVAFAVLTAVGYFLLCQNSTQTARGLLRQDIALAGGMERGKSVQELSIFTGKIDEQDLAAGNRLLTGIVRIPRPLSAVIMGTCSMCRLLCFLLVPLCCI